MSECIKSRVANRALGTAVFTVRAVPCRAVNGYFTKKKHEFRVFHDFQPWFRLSLTNNSPASQPKSCVSFSDLLGLIFKEVLGKISENIEVLGGKNGLNNENKCLNSC